MAERTMADRKPIHDLFSGSPDKVGLDVIQDAGRIGRPLYKARRIDFSSMQDSPLKNEEVYISSKCKVEEFIANNEAEVIVVEGLLLFEKVFNAYFESEYNDDKEVQDDINLLLELAAAGSVENLNRAHKLRDQLKEKEINGASLSKEDKNLISRVMQAAKPTSHKDMVTFSGFAYGMLLATRSVDAPAPSNTTDFLRQQTFEAATGIGFSTFKAILGKALSFESKGNPHMELLCNDPKMALLAFAKLFQARIFRNVASHPFAFIGGDERASKKAMDALGIFKANHDKFPEFQILMKAGTPFLEGYVSTGLQNAKKERQRVNQDDERALAYFR